MSRIAVLLTSSPTNGDALVAAFVKGLNALGYYEGKNVLLDVRFASGQLERLPGLAAELMNLRPDVVYAPTGPSALAVKKISGDAPIVFSNVFDPVSYGLASTLARPDRNMTGLSLMSADLVAKRVELLSEVVPGLSRLGVIYILGYAGNVIQLQEAKRAATALGKSIFPAEAVKPEDLAAAIGSITKSRANGLLVIGNTTYYTNRAQIAAIAVRSKLPTMNGSSEYVVDGGLISYGPVYTDLSRRAASYVHRILKGAKPSDLPIEQPEQFELAINMRTAKELGLKISQAVLVRADRVIE